MLGYFLGITLVLTVLSPLIFVDVFADSLVVNFDKSLYTKGDSLTISGEILEFGMPVIAMSIYDPDGKILSANNLDISPEKTFSKTFLLDSPFYEKIGEYMIKLDYGRISESHYFVIESHYSEPEILTETFEEPEIILLYTEKKQYTDKDVIKISGLVSVLDSPSVLIGIYDPFGMPAGFYFGSINSNLEFSTSFLVKAGVNFRVDGTYSIKAHYAETEATSFFDYYKVPQKTIEDKIESTPEDKIKESKYDEEKIDETTNEIISDLITNQSSEQTINEENTNDSNSVIDTLIINTPPKSKSESNGIPITKNVSDTISPKKIMDLKIKETKIIGEKNDLEKIVSKNKIKKSNNLTVEDIELGLLLNQINLKCDSSVFTDTISYYDGMGPALYRLCKFDSSLNFFNESLIKNPNDVEVLVNKGSTLGKLGYFSEAILYYDQAINIDPTFLPAKNNKANALANLENFDDAIMLYDEILEKNPDYLIARKNLDIALSLTSHIPNFSDGSLESHVEHIVYLESSLSEKITPLNQEKQKSTSFFDEMSLAFSTLSSLFDFPN